MRVHSILPPAVFLFAAVLQAGDPGDKLQWARETIDAHAVIHHFEPPARSSGTRWQVARIEGCTVELKETEHRDVPDSVFTGDGVFDLSEEKVVTWTFDLAELQSDFVTADTSTGMPHLQIFAAGDVFRLNTESISKALRKDGSTANTTSWSTPGNARNLWMYFDSPATDNKAAVRRLETDFRSAIHDCAPKKKIWKRR